MLNKLGNIAVVVLILVGLSLDYDKLSMPALLAVLGIALGIALLVYATSPRACRQEIQAADDGYFER
jgi:hypothetical protein